MTPIVHLHRETKILPFKEHGEMLTKQFLLNCHFPGHPSNKLLDRPAPERPSRKPTILRLKKSIEHLLPVPDNPSLKQSIKRVHTETIQCLQLANMRTIKFSMTYHLKKAQKK